MARKKYFFYFLHGDAKLASGSREGLIYLSQATKKVACHAAVWQKL